METKHTNKNWTVQVNETNKQEIFVKTNLAAIARCFADNSEVRHYETAIANAKLIAAAPDLLEALIETLDLLSKFREIYNEQGSLNIDNKAINAIKKATS